MRTFLITLFFTLLAATPLAWPASQLLNQGYMSLTAYLVTLVTISFMAFVLVLCPGWRRATLQEIKKAELMRKSINQARANQSGQNQGDDAQYDFDDALEWIMNHRGPSPGLNTLSPQQEATKVATGLGVLTFICFLATSAFWFDFSSSRTFAGDVVIGYDRASKEVFNLNGTHVYLWETPENLWFVPEANFTGHFTDRRPYQHHATGQIVGYNTQTWDSTFELTYNVPQPLRLQHLRAGTLPNYDGKMSVVFRDSVDLMYYHGLGNFPTTSDLQQALRQEVEDRCANAFNAESCPVSFRVNVPHFPRRGAVNPGPGDNST